MEKKKILVLTGPTGIGKTETSIQLAKDLGGEIISADSMQVYRYMNIGSGKITKEEMDGVPHHLIDILDPKESFDVTVFQALAKKAVDEITSRGHLPIVVGGTGFYIQALLKDVAFTEEETNPSYRQSLQSLYDAGGVDELYEKLRAIDPESAASIPKENRNRLIRALEFFETTGTKISLHNAREKEKQSPYDYRYLVLTRDREEMYRRIDRRFDQMMADGFLDEVRFLKEYGCKKEMTSMQGLGYKQLFRFLSGEGTLEEAIEKSKQETRHFAKRQLTWFRRETGVRWIQLDKESYDDVRNAGDFSQG